MSFQRKVGAFQRIQWQNDQQPLTDPLLDELAKKCLEPEIIDLTQMYGASKALQTLPEIYSARYQAISHHVSSDIQEAVLRRLCEYGGSKQRLGQLLDEEQQRELEQELEEERQSERPPIVQPCNPILHGELGRLCDTDGSELNLAGLPDVFRPLSYAFTETTLVDGCEIQAWGRRLWISTEVQRVVLAKGDALNPFMRPPRWLVLYRNTHIVFLSAHEANWLFGRFQSNTIVSSTLRLLLPRIRRTQSIFVNTPTLTIPPSIASSHSISAEVIPLEQLVQLFIFNGTLYFDSTDEQTAYCQCLGLCPKPRTPEEDDAFEKGWISVDGFVSKLAHRHKLKIPEYRFTDNPLAFVKQLIEIRNNTHTPVASHVGSIILNSLKSI